MAKKRVKLNGQEAS